MLSRCVSGGVRATRPRSDSVAAGAAKAERRKTADIQGFCYPRPEYPRLRMPKPPGPIDI